MHSSHKGSGEASKASNANITGVAKPMEFPEFEIATEQRLLQTRTEYEADYQVYGILG